MTSELLCGRWLYAEFIEDGFTTFDEIVLSIRPNLIVVVKSLDPRYTVPAVSRLFNLI